MDTKKITKTNSGTALTTSTVASTVAFTAVSSKAAPLKKEKELTTEKSGKPITHRERKIVQDNTLNIAHELQRKGPYEQWEVEWV